MFFICTSFILDPQKKDSGRILKSAIQIFFKNMTTYCDEPSTGKADATVLENYWVEMNSLHLQIPMLCIPWNIPENLCFCFVIIIIILRVDYGFNFRCSESISL